MQGANNNKRRHNSPKPSAPQRSRSRSHDNSLWRDSVELYNQTGVGRTAQQQQVQRFSMASLLPLRLQYLAAPPEDIWKPEPKVVWVDPTRQEQIQTLQESYLKKFVPLRDLPQRQRSRLVSSKLGDMQQQQQQQSEATVDDALEAANSNQFDDNKSVASVASIGTLGSQFDIDDNPLRKTMLLLNKLSWTTLDKLTPQIINIMDSVDVTTTTNSDSSSAAAAILDVKTIFGFILEKAQMEVHFGPMYAQVCKRLLNHNKAWRKLLLQLCQAEFQIDIAQRIQQQMDKEGGGADTDFSLHSNESEERDYQILLIRKKYFGHLQFIGELFKLKIIKLDIMLWCLGRLLFKDTDDTNNDNEADENAGGGGNSKAATTTNNIVSEDQLECFAKLMTVVGAVAEDEIDQSGKSNERWDQCWEQVQKYLEKPSSQSTEDGAPAAFISSRIRFLLKDLWDLKQNGWMERRAKETAKTLAEIHQDVQEEEQQARSRAKSEDFHRPTRRHRHTDPGPHGLPKRSDSEGYINIPNRKQNNRWSSNDNLRRSKSAVDAPKFPSSTYQKKARSSAAPAPIPRAKVARSKSHGDASPVSQLLASHSSQSSKGKGRKSNSPNVKNNNHSATAPPVEIITYPSPVECQDKCKNILKEFFISGELDDAVLSFDEMIGASTAKTPESREESCERGANVIEAGILLVMEMKQVEVDKFLAVVRKILETHKLEKDSLSRGLSVPLEFLLDIEVDAPMAGSLLARIVADWVVPRDDALKLDKLLLEESPELFRTDGNPAVFACKVFKAMAKTMESITDADLSIVTKLMTDRDKETYSSSRDLLQTFLS